MRMVKSKTVIGIQKKDWKEECQSARSSPQGAVIMYGFSFVCSYALLCTCQFSYNEAFI